MLPGTEPRIEPKKEPKKEPKHVRFYINIGKLSTSITRLRKLIDKIEGAESQESIAADKLPEEPIPSLTNFLNEQPERVEKLNGELLSQLERMEQLLF